MAGVESLAPSEAIVEIAADGIHPEAVPRNLDIHSDIPTQIGVQSAYFINVNPQNTIENASQINFRIVSSLNEIIHPSKTRQKMRIQIRKFDGPKATDGSSGEGKDCWKRVETKNKGGGGTEEVEIEENKVIPVNNIIQSIWKNVLVKINDQVVSNGESMYAYRGDIESKLMTTNEGKKNLRLGGFYEEKRPWESVKDKKIDWKQDFPPLLKPNEFDPGWQKRYGFTHNEESKGIWEISGPIHSEVFELANKILPPETILNVEFTKHHQNGFYLLTDRTENQNTYLIEILDMQLEIHYLVCDAELVQEMKEVALKKPYTYSLRQVIMRWINQPSGITSINSINLLATKNKLPRRLFVGFVDSRAFAGKQNLDPFHYQHLNMTDSVLTIGNANRPYPLIKYHYPELTQALLAMQDATSGTFSDEYIGYDCFDLKNRCFLLCYKISPSDSAPGQCFEMLAPQPISLLCSLSKPTDTVYIMVVYAEYDAEMTINVLGRVEVDK